MRRPLISLTLLGLLAPAAAAQPAPADPAEPAEPAEAPSPAPTAPPPPPVPVEEPTASRKPLAGFDKGFFLRSEDDRYSLNITGRIQPFFNLTRRTEPTDYRSQFEVRRARLVLDGNLHGKALTYKLQTDFGRGVPSVRDAHFDVGLAKDLWLRFGQWKRPFSRQQITSSGRLELTDRSITDRAFGAGRDVGIALRNNYEKSPDLEWTVGVFNGTGEAPRLTGDVIIDPTTGEGMLGPTTNTNVPAKFKPAVVARIGINRNGLKGYSEADLEGGPARFGVAASVWLEGDFDDNDQSNQKVNLDYIVKASGFSTTGGLYAMTAQTDVKLADAELALVGFHLQAGYMLDPTWQVAARYALVDDPGQKATSAVDQQEISVGANYYGAGHDAKFAGAVRLIKTGDADFTDVILFELGANVGW